MFYDIHTHNKHTHNKHTLETDKNDSKFILNVFPSDFEQAYDECPDNVFSCGIHPWYSNENEINLLEKISLHESVVAIGEAGLDKLRGPSLSNQILIFKQQILFSEKLSKPMIIHCVKAWDILLSVHKDIKPKSPWIIHGFRGNYSLANQLIQRGMYVSFGERFNIDTIKSVPIDKMFCETDESNLPIEDIYNRISASLEISLQHFKIQIEQNIDCVFKL